MSYFQPPKSTAQLQKKTVSWPGFRGPQKLVFCFFAFFAKFRPASGDPSLGFGAPFWTPRKRFYGPGARKTQKNKKLRKPSQVMEPTLQT